jgi:hypothetical protein
LFEPAADSLVGGEGDGAAVGDESGDERMGVLAGDGYAPSAAELGRYVRYREADVLAWLEECMRPGRPVAVRPVRTR